MLSLLGGLSLEQVFLFTTVLCPQGQHPPGPAIPHSSKRDPLLFPKSVGFRNTRIPEYQIPMFGSGAAVARHLSVTVTSTDRQSATRSAPPGTSAVTLAALLEDLATRACDTPRGRHGDDHAGAGARIGHRGQRAVHGHDAAWQARRPSARGLSALPMTNAANTLRHLTAARPDLTSPTRACCRTCPLPAAQCPSPVHKTCHLPPAPHHPTAARRLLWHGWLLPTAYVVVDGGQDEVQTVAVDYLEDGTTGGWCQVKNVSRRVCGAMFGNRRLQPITSACQTLVFWYSEKRNLKFIDSQEGVSMSSVWLIRELFGWGHWTWRWGNSQRCEKVDYQDWSPCQPRRAPSTVINRRYTIKESIQLEANWRINEGSCARYHVTASGTRVHGVEVRIQANG
ncbi:hypothetical protein GGX14DRAFT_384304 [Mycena pura]|uniref:Uncharacterized protein n=1 Tax=Mycena pura TaxID=153505 RepID=A0AAD7E6N2_9AGAR|nr:hypothetical protein GGX14DRAFT_384304 [Mycena pura]